MDKNVFKGHSKIMTFLISGNFNGSMKVHYLVYLVPYVQFFLHLGSDAWCKGGGYSETNS